MKNYKVIVSYDGTNYNGYQKQKNLPSIQEAIETALKTIHNSPVKTFASGRTDKGVHALGQVLNFESSLKLSPLQFKKSLNALLPNDIVIKSVSPINSSFHARYSSVSKEYHYYLNVGSYDPFKRNYIFQYNQPLAMDKMISASKLFLNEHNFINFCAAETNKNINYIRTLYKIEITKKNNIVVFKFIGNGFLRYMVRMIVSILIQIGSNQKDESFIKERLDCPDLKRSNYKISPCGLYLAKVNY